MDTNEEVLLTDYAEEEEGEIVPKDFWHNCEYCDKNFRVSKLLLEHQLRKHPGLKVSDLINNLAGEETYYSSDSDCEYVFEIKIVKTKKTREQFNETAALQVKPEPTYDSSEEEVDEGPKECQYCGKKFNILYSLKEHILFYHVIESGVVDVNLDDLTNFDCPECGMKLKHKRSYRKHLKIVHNLIVNGHGFKDPIKFPIDEYPWLEELGRRVSGPKKRADPNPKFCYTCNRQFNNIRLLRQHQKLYHKKPDAIIKLDIARMTEYVCFECGRDSSSATSFLKHLKLCHNMVVENSRYCKPIKDKYAEELVNNMLKEQFPIFRAKSPTSNKLRLRCGLCDYGP